MPRDPIASWFFSLAVVRKRDRFLIVHEREHGQRWYLPAGRAEPGESLPDAARRETLEESGVPVELEGVLEVQHLAYPECAKVRAIFLARPCDDTPPLAPPGNEHSLEARWVTLEELDGLPLRSPEVRSLFSRVAAGELQPAPLSLLASDGLGR